MSRGKIFYMSNQQTAVEWLIDEIDMQYPQIDIRWKQWMIDRAKQMEKEQIETAYNAGREYGCKYDDPETFEQYFNQTFKTESE